MDNIIEKLEKKREKIYEKLFEIDEQIRNAKISSINLDIEGKYIRYKDVFGIVHYCHVTDVMSDELYCANHDTKYAYLIRGHGFDGEFTGYGDATNFYWSYWYEFTISSIDIDNFVKEVNKIEIITKEEFENEFETQWSKLKNYKEKYENDNNI